MLDKLPDYASRLAALHEALRDDFRNIVGQVPLRGQKTVVDAGCGDGFFTALLAANQFGVIGLDTSIAYLRAAQAALRNFGHVQFVPGDARRLPFEDASVDLVWSAHSMHSYPDVRHCLAEFRRVLRPGGVIAILESDNVHSVMLSWPPDLELAVRQAEHCEIGDEDSYIGSYFPRFATQLLEERGFQSIKQQYFLITRFGPASEPLSQFVLLYLQNLLEQTSANLTEKMRSRLAQLADATSDKFLPRQKTFTFTSLQVLTTAYSTIE